MSCKRFSAPMSLPLSISSNVSESPSPTWPTIENCGASWPNSSPRKVRSRPQRTALRQRRRSRRTARTDPATDPPRCRVRRLGSQNGHARGQRARVTAHKDATGRPVSERGAQLLNRVFSGQAVVLRPDYNFMLRKKADPRPETIGMGLLAPVHDPDDSEQIIAAIMIRSRSLLQAFDAILAHGHFETTGEAYVFNRQGMMLSESRFVEQLTRTGLLKSEATETPASARLVLEVKDPGGDMTRGFAPSLPRSAQPLTEMVRLAATGQEGCNVRGYRDYRGVLVVGAWNWLAVPMSALRSRSITTRRFVRWLTCAAVSLPSGS